MKHSFYILLGAMMLLLNSCKENTWMDWKAQNDRWLELNAKKEGVITTDDGLQYRIIADPDIYGAMPNSDSYVVCEYTGKLINGYQFDGGVSQMQLSATVAGFSEGLRHIHCNGDIEIYVPASLGYDQEHFTGKGKIEEAEGTGTEGTTGYIPPYSVMIFTIHLCAVN